MFFVLFQTESSYSNLSFHIGSDDDPLDSECSFLDDCSSSEAESVVEETPVLTLTEQLIVWKLTEDTTIQSCDSLLKVLRPYHPELPLSTRTLVGTPRHVLLTKMDPGYYHHFSLEACVREAIFPLKAEELPNPLEGFLGTDGVSLTNSSCSMFYPIVGVFPSVSKQVVEVGVYHGFSKPLDSNVFLGRAIEEANSLYTTGMNYQGRNIRVKIKALIGDAPIRSWASCTKGHPSKCEGCAFCTGSGIDVGIPRTDLSFRQRRDRSRHYRTSVLESLEDFDLISGIPLDAMHLVDYGIFRKMLDYLLRTKYPIPNVTLNPATIRQMNAAFLSLSNLFSRLDFARPPRSFKELPRWKSAEFRQLLHYSGVVLFRRFLGGSFYNHFLHLHIGIKLLSYDPWFRIHNANAHDLISKFIRRTPALFTDSFVCYNLHGGFHLAECCLALDLPLYDFSTYIFENHYGSEKKLLRKNDKPLAQLVKRIYERRKNRHLLYKKPKSPRQIELLNPHASGPLVRNCKGKQFKKAVKNSSWTITCFEPNNCIYLSDLTVVIVRNIVQTPQATVVIGNMFLNQTDIYKYPRPSSMIHEFQVSNLSRQFQAWDIKDVKCKAVKLPAYFPNLNDEFAVFPLLGQTQ